MDLRSLRHLVTLARVLNYSKAAEELGISQPVLSRSIKAFEREQGVQFFDRDRRGVSLTPIGRSFISRAEVVLQEFDELEATLKRTTQGEVGELAFGVAPMPAKPLLANLIGEFSSSAPGLSLSSYVRNVDALLSLLESEEIECFVSVEAFFPEPYNLKSSFLGYFPIAPVVRAGHPLLTGSVESGQTFKLLISSNTKPVPYVPQSLGPYISKDDVIVVEDMDILAGLALDSDAIWMTSPFVVLEAMENDQLDVLPLSEEEPVVRLPLMMYSLSRRSLSPAAVQLKSLIQHGVQELSARLAG